MGFLSSWVRRGQTAAGVGAAGVVGAGVVGGCVVVASVVGVSVVALRQNNDSSVQAGSSSLGTGTDNIDLAAQNQGFPTNLPWFYDQVKNGAPWDYKQQGAQYENFGNFNYGMTAAAAGIPEQVALRAAGWAQERAGTSRDEWGNPTDLGGSYGDDPADQQQIRDGYAYHESGLWRVWGG